MQKKRLTCALMLGIAGLFALPTSLMAEGTFNGKKIDGAVLMTGPFKTLNPNDSYMSWSVKGHVLFDGKPMSIAVDSASKYSYFWVATASGHPTFIKPYVESVRYSDIFFTATPPANMAFNVILGNTGLVRIPLSALNLNGLEQRTPLSRFTGRSVHSSIIVKYIGGIDEYRDYEGVVPGVIVSSGAGAVTQGASMAVAGAAIGGIASGGVAPVLGAAVAAAGVGGGGAILGGMESGAAAVAAGAKQYKYLYVYATLEQASAQNSIIDVKPVQVGTDVYQSYPAQEFTDSQGNKYKVMLKFTGGPEPTPSRVERSSYLGKTQAGQNLLSLYLIGAPRGSFEMTRVPMPNLNQTVRFIPIQTDSRGGIPERLQVTLKKDFRGYYYLTVEKQPE